MMQDEQSYLTPKCEVRKNSEKGGHAVYAASHIQQGEVIAVWSGKLVASARLETLPPAVRRFSLQVEEDLYLVSLTNCEPADLINHSCEPNAGLLGQISLVAMRDIAPGEEITYDYATSDGSSYDEFSCGCGSELCRGRVSGDDWMRADLWNRYKGHYSPYLARRIRKLVAFNQNQEKERAPVLASAPGSNGASRTPVHVHASRR